MALTNYSLPVSIPSNPVVGFNSDLLDIFNSDNEYFNDSNIYNISITTPDIIENTEEIPQWKKTLNKIFSYISATTLVFLMLGMGSHVDWKEVLGNFWPPLPILIGMCGQFVILPALAFGFAKWFKMEAFVALGCLIISCSPGGAFSNFFTYWVNGDVALSLVMTTCSTIMSFGTMPLNLWIYSPHLVGNDSKNVVLPYKNILITLCFVCGPVIVGMIIRHFSKKIAKKTTQITSTIGYIMIAFNLVCILILFGEPMAAATWHIHASVILLPLIAMSLAYIIAYVSKLSHKVCRTIAIETASQNIPVALGIIALSFSEIEVRKKLMLYPTLYCMYMFTEICVGAALFQLYFRWKGKGKNQQNTEKPSKKQFFDTDVL